MMKVVYLYSPYVGLGCRNASSCFKKYEERGGFTRELSGIQGKDMKGAEEKLRGYG